MNQYIVDLRGTNGCQTIIVLSEHPNEMQEFVDRIEDLNIENAHVEKVEIYRGLVHFDESKLSEAV